MATDFLLLKRYPRADAARFRHYHWQRPAFTFGYAQKIDFVRARLPRDEPLDVTRRATGGGIVDHREDWTYALVIPREHELWKRPGPAIYHAVHDALVAALNALGADVRLQRELPETEPGVCFERPEIDDVVLASDGRKVAGAALKRAKHAVLLQGSIWRPLVPHVDWNALEEKFPETLAFSLGLGATQPGWPDFDAEEEQMLVDQYASHEWIDAR
jgi:lipoate-protein ligase A